MRLKLGVAGTRTVDVSVTYDFFFFFNEMCAAAPVSLKAFLWRESIKKCIGL